MKLILDLAVIAIIAICVWSGYRKGLVMGLGTILALIIAVIAGNLLSSAYSSEVIPAMRPFASGYIDGLMQSSVYEALGVESSELSVDDLLAQDPALAATSATIALEQLGFQSDAAAKIAGEAASYSGDGSISLTDAVTDLVCSYVAFAAGFLLVFLLVLILLTVIGNITNLSFRIPYLGRGNEIGGLICGAVTGLMFCTVLAWVFRFAGIIFPDGMLDSTWLLSFFMNHNLLSVYLGI